MVGPKGATIKHIQQQTHTYIVTPSRDKEPVFEVTGLPDSVQSARRQIEAHIALRTGNQAQPGLDMHGLDLSDDVISQISQISQISPSQEFLSSLYKNGLGSLLNLNCYMEDGQTPPEIEEMQRQQMMPMTSSTGSSTCSSSSSSSGKSASLMRRPDLVDIWKTLGGGDNSLTSLASLECDEGIGESPINIWSLQKGSSASASASPTDSLLAGGQADRQKRECLMCGDKEVTHVLVPCGHNMFCQECATRLCSNGGACPICSQSVGQAMRILV